MIKNFLKKILGITDLENKIKYLEELDKFTLSDVVNNLSKSYLIMAHNQQQAYGNHIVVPADKSGVLVLGKNSVIANCWIESQKNEGN
jgi:hypothetical protein